MRLGFRRPWGAGEGTRRPAAGGEPGRGLGGAWLGFRRPWGRRPLVLGVSCCRQRERIQREAGGGGCTRQGDKGRNWRPAAPAIRVSFYTSASLCLELWHPRNMQVLYDFVRTRRSAAQEEIRWLTPRALSSLKPPGFGSPLVPAKSGLQGGGGEGDPAIRVLCCEPHQTLFQF